MTLTISPFLTAALVAAATHLIISRFLLYLRLRSFPGPFFAKFSKFWLAWGAATGKLNADFETLCERYGPVVRISGYDLITDDPEIFSRINAVRSPYSRSEFYVGARLDPKHDNILSCRDEGRHQRLRVKMAAGVCMGSFNCTRRRLVFVKSIGVYLYSVD
ncbi:hypothetical protein GP486_002599 [Trichoglossum hirsutum]|uniref:Cytochrome P450 n=1 Tax=Trichoglossum hirsutum TaxID=265104 RepID=A0A9P8LEW6_9PEZI|nr:hypothetical protein GP486_002599 [Trichoglossum hirsutum]